MLHITADDIKAIAPSSNSVLVNSLRGPLNSRRACQRDQPLRLQLYFGPKLYVEASFTTPPSRKGDELFTTLWTRGSEGCSTRRHGNCDEGQPPSEKEVERHRQNQESR